MTIWNLGDSIEVFIQNTISRGWGGGKILLILEAKKCLERGDSLISGSGWRPNGGSS